MGLEFDEAFSVQSGFLDLPALLNLLATSEPHPPFYYSFIHVWYPLAGTTEFALRYPSLWANVLTIAFLIRLARFLGWRAAGLVAAVLFALNPYQIWYAQEVRMYAPVALFGAATVCFSLAYEQRGGRGILALAAASTLLALATHYFAIFLFALLNVYVVARLASRGRWPQLRAWLIAQAVVGGLLLAWLAYVSRVSLHYARGYATVADLVEIVKTALVDYAVGTSIAPELGAQLALGFLAMVGVGLIAAAVGWGSRNSAPTSQPRSAGALARPGGSGTGEGARALEERALSPGLRAAFLGSYLLVPLSLAFLFSLWRPMYAPNYFMVSAPAFYLALGLGVVGLFRLFPPLGVAAGLFLVGAQLSSVQNYFTDPRYNKAEVADAIQYIESHRLPGDGIVLDGWGQATQFWYYAVLRDHDLGSAPIFPPNAPDPWGQMPKDVDAIMAKHSGVWLLDYGVSELDVNHLVETYLAQHDYQAYYHRLLRNRVVFYAAPPNRPPTLTAIGDSCDGQIGLADFQSFGTAAKPGEIVPVGLHFQALRAVTTTYAVSWRLKDAAGHTVLQRDSEPAAGFSPTTTWPAGADVVDRFGMVVPPSLPPGAYTLSAIVYDKTSGRTCQLQHGDTAVPASEIPLETIQVANLAPVPTFDAAPPPQPASAVVGGLRFLGWSFETGPYHPGDRVPVRLFWQVDQTTPTDAVVQTRLIGPDGNVVLDAKSPLGPENFPTSQWQAGRSVATYVDVAIPKQATTGAYRLALTTVGVGAGPVPLPGPAEPIQVVAPPRSFALPSVPVPLDANFAGLIRLRGYALSPAAGQNVAPGQTLDLTLFWQDAAEMNTSYKVFTHLVGPDGKLAGQQDAFPQGGQATTDSWVTGQVVADHYAISVSPQAPPGKYELQVGWYEPTSGQRLSLSDRPIDSLPIAEVTVSGKGG